MTGEEKTYCPTKELDICTTQPKYKKLLLA